MVEHKANRDVPRAVFTNYNEARELADEWNGVAEIGLLDPYYGVTEVFMGGESNHTCNNLVSEEGTNGKHCKFSCSACGYMEGFVVPDHCPNCGAKVV